MSSCFNMILSWWLGCGLLFILPGTHSASIGRNVPCEPGELIFVDCNLCSCNSEGFPNAVCAKMWCPPPPKNKPSEGNEVSTA